MWVSWIIRFAIFFSSHSRFCHSMWLVLKYFSPIKSQKNCFKIHINRNGYLHFTHSFYLHSTCIIYVCVNCARLLEVVPLYKQIRLRIRAKIIAIMYEDKIWTNLNPFILIINFDCFHSLRTRQDENTPHRELIQYNIIRIGLTFRKYNIKYTIFKM